MRRTVLFILAFFFAASVVSAQDPPYADTVVTSMPMESGEPPASFSPLRQTAPVDVRKVPREKTEALQKSDDYWYANAEPAKEPEKTEKGGGLFAALWFWNLLWILALCSIIAVVVWYLASSNIRLFQKKSKAATEEAEESGVSTDDIFSINYDKEIRKAEAAANYRLAVRLWYLQTLKALADRGVINYRAEKPNGDYVNALAGGPHYRDFFRLTRAFEYAWYGQFALSEGVYQTLRPEFLNFKNSLSA